MKNFEPKYETMIENAFYQSKPLNRSARLQAKPLPPLHAYIHHLLFVELSKNNLKEVLKRLRKLPWDQTEIKDAVRKFDALYLQACA